MSDLVAVALINFATRFGIAASIEIAKAIKSKATIDDLIDALGRAETKTAADYKAEALEKRNIGIT